MFVDCMTRSYCLDRVVADLELKCTAPNKQ